MFQTILQKDNSPESIQKITEHYYQTVYPFYLEKGITHTIESNGKKISCRIFLHPEAKSKILIVNGYNETYLKYAAVIYDLYQKGYSVYAYDHRGQGFSEKYPHQRKRGYLKNFDDLVNDLENVYKFVNKHHQKLSVSVLAHSMGGAVSILAAGKEKISPAKLILSAPMFGIQVNPLSAMEYPVYLSTVFLSKLGFGSTYAFGQRDCFPLIPFEENRVTHSKARYEIWQTHLRETPDAQMGGPTFQWVREGIRGSREAREMKNPKNSIPVLLLQAEKEELVINDNHKIFIENWQGSEISVVQHAKHEVLMEIETLRNHVFEQIFNFLG